MRLRMLRLRNYRRFRDATLEFPDGVIAVTGPNGAGKSTIIESITWCLFGNEAARTQKELIKRAGAAPGEDTDVRIEFELDGANYAVSRRLRGKSQQSEAQVEVDGVLVVAPGANSAEQVTKRVARALGMDRRGFQATVVANQGDLSALSDTHPGERKRLILSLLGIDAIDGAITFVRNQKREATIRLEETRRLVARATELRGRRTVLLEEVQAARTAHAAAVADSQERLERWKGLGRAATTLADARHRHRDLRGRLEGLQRTLQVHHDQAGRLGAELQLLDQRSHELARLHAEGLGFNDLDARLAAADAGRLRRASFDRLVADRSAIDRETARWEADAAAAPAEGAEDALQADLDAVRQSVEAIAARLAAAETHVHHLEADRRRLQADAADHGDRWRDLKELGPHAPCPTCERTLGDVADRLSRAAAAQQSALHARVERLVADHVTGQEAVAALRREHASARTLLAEREKALAVLRQLLDRANVARAERARLAQRRLIVQAELDALPVVAEPAPDATALERERAARDRWRQQVARLETEVARAPRMRAELATKAGETETTRREIETASRELTHTEYREGSWEEAQRAADSQRALLHEVERRRDVLAERLSGNQSRLDLVEKDLVEMSEVEAQAERLAERVRIGEALAADRGDQGLLPEFRRHLIGRIRPALGRAAADLVAEMTGSRYTEIVIDEDYAIRVFDGGQAWPVERFSGGEVDIINLAVRLAVSELLARARRASRLQFVALDEVLAAQDESRRRNVLHALKGLGRHFRQVLLVTHLDEVRERVDHVIRVVPLPDGTSRFHASWDEGGETSTQRVPEVAAVAAAPDGRSAPVGGRSPSARSSGASLARASPGNPIR